MPEEDPIVATDVLLLFQVPPVVASLRVIVAPIQTAVGDGPEIGDGNALICTETVRTQPDGMV